MSDDDFDPTKLDLSSEENIPVKRPFKAKECLSSDLPNPLDLLKSVKKPEKPIVTKKLIKKIDYSKSVISKPAIMKKSEADDIEQYDYFASQSSAILDNWKSPQDIPDSNGLIDRKKFIKKVNMKQNNPDHIAASLERELARREKAKSGLKRWKKDEEVKMKQQYDS